MKDIYILDNDETIFNDLTSNLKRSWNKIKKIQSIKNLSNF